MLLLAALAVALPAFAAGNNRIVAVEEDGHTVYVDQPAPATTPPPTDSAPAPHRILVYYSIQEHRWKRVPGQSPSVTKAHSAALDVAHYVDSLPATAPVKQEPTELAKPSTGTPTITREQLDQAIDDAARQHGVDPELVRAVIKVESNYNPRAVSRKGAVGLMQLMPGTARKLRVNPYDPQQNIEGGVRHLADLLATFDGDLERSLAAYNAGAGSVQRSNGIPPYRETRDYVRRITNMYSGTTPYHAGGTPIRVLRQSNGVLLFTNE